jgi:hypothetical protein
MPYDLVIDTEIIVDQPVPHSGHVPPRHKGKGCREIGMDLLVASPMISRLRTTALVNTGSSTKES